MLKDAAVGVTARPQAPRPAQPVPRERHAVDARRFSINRPPAHATTVDHAVPNGTGLETRGLTCERRPNKPAAIIQPAPQVDGRVTAEPVQLQRSRHLYYNATIS